MPTKARSSRSKSPTVEKYMTAVPFTIGRTQTLRTALEMMRRHEIRHLPVLEAGQLVGALSQRELHLIQTLPGVSIDEVKVDEAMATDVYRVAPGASLTTVAEEMAEKKLGSAVVMDEDRVVGIFTTIDALRALADTARRR